MRIVIATPFYPPHTGVLATYAVGLEDAFTKMGHEVCVVTFDSSLPAGLSHGVYFVRMLIALRNASFVLSLDTWSVGLPAFFAARVTGTPFRVRIGGDFLYETYLDRTQELIRLSDFYTHPRQFNFKERVIMRWLAHMTRHAEMVIFNSRFQRDIWRRPYALVETRTRVIENYFPPTSGTYLPAKGPVIVSAQRGSTFKNLAMLQRVVARLADEHSGLELDTRLLPRDENLRRLAQAHAVVIPSLSEVSSNTAIECVSLGKPFICPEDTGTSERLADCGLFVDTRSESALTQAIESLLDPNTYQRLASAARSFSFTHSWEEIAKEIVNAHPPMAN